MKKQKINRVQSLAFGIGFAIFAGFDFYTGINWLGWIFAILSALIIIGSLVPNKK